MRILPFPCLVCQEPLWPHEPAPYEVCPRCWLYFAAHQDRSQQCRICSQPLLGKKELCQDCGRKTWAFDRITGLFPYQSPGGDLVRRYKLAPSPRLCRFLAHLLGPSLLPGSTVVPVPPMASHLRHRGWDPVGMLAQELCREQKCELVPCLGRREGESQKKLHLEGRQANAQRSFHLRRKFSPRGPVWVLDDVVTSGYTAHRCAQLLKEAGAPEVSILCLCLH